MHNSITTRRVTLLSLIGIVALALLLLLAFNQTQKAEASHGGLHLTVNSSSDASDLDPGDGVCDTGAFFILNECTLRAAIEESNAFNGPRPDYILFDTLIGGSTLVLESNLTPVIDGVVIDASTCAPPADNCTNAGFIVDGNGWSCLVFDEDLGGAPNGFGSTVRGLTIRNCSGYWDSFFDGGIPSGPGGITAGEDYPECSGDGICVVSNSNHVIGGDAGIGNAPAGQGNVIHSNDCNGIRIENSFGTFGGDQILGNRIGTTPDGGSPAGNGCNGIEIIDTIGNQAGDIVIGQFGGTGAQGFRNIIAANGGDGSGDGIRIIDTDARVNIFNNYIGLNVSGLPFDFVSFAPLANDTDGIHAEDHAALNIIGNRIGGGFNDLGGTPTPIGEDGIDLESDAEGANLILANCIGFGANCFTPAPFSDDGIELDDTALPTYIGDGTTANRNVIGWTGYEFQNTGIEVDDAEVHINNNIIGLAADGATPAPIQGDCVNIDQDDITGSAGPSSVVNNTIGYCQDGGDGIEIEDTMSGQGTLIDNNKIGLEISGMSPAPISSDCIDLDYATDTTISNNVIGNCGSEGIEAFGDTIFVCIPTVADPFCEISDLTPVAGGDNLTITNNLIGFRADGATPAPTGLGTPPFSFNPCIELIGVPSPTGPGTVGSLVAGNSIGNCNHQGIYAENTTLLAIDNNNIGLGSNGTTAGPIWGACIFVTSSFVAGGINLNMITNNDIANCRAGDPVFGDGSIILNDASGNTVTGNTIVSPPSSDAIVVQGFISTGNLLQGNTLTMVSPDGADIPHDLRFDPLNGDGSTPNDVGDVDSGPNGFHNWPVMPGTSAVLNCANGTAGGGDTVEVYQVSGTTYTPLGTIIAAANGSWSLCGLPGNITVTATATVGTGSITDPVNSTSEMSPTVQTVAGALSIMGDNNCNGIVEVLDQIQIGLFIAGLTVTNPGSCPEVGDNVTINGVPNMIWGAYGPCMSPAMPTVFDQVKGLNFIAGNPVSPFAGCPALGDAISLATPNP